MTNRNFIFSLAAAGILGVNLPALETSPLDKVNIRLLLHHIKETLSVSMENSISEFNTQETRDSVTGPVRDILKQSGLVHHVFCDETNNPPSVVDNYDLVVVINIHPPGKYSPMIRLTANMRFMES